MREDLVRNIDQWSLLRILPSKYIMDKDNEKLLLKANCADYSQVQVHFLICFLADLYLSKLCVKEKLVIVILSLNFLPNFIPKISI